MSTTPPTIQPQTGIVWYQGVSSGTSSIGFIASMPSSEGIEKEIAVRREGLADLGDVHVRVLVGDDDLALDLAALQGAELEIGGILLAGLDVADELALAGLGDVAGDFGGDVVDGGFPLVDKGDLDARVVPDIEFGGDLDGLRVKRSSWVTGMLISCSEVSCLRASSMTAS